MEPSVSIASALTVPLRSTAQVRALLEAVGALACRRAALELDLADVLAWLRRRDPAELGHVTWTAFCGERVDWRGSWLRDMVRLAESPLDKVRAAAAEGLLPLRIAVEAPGTVAEDAQDAWLADAVLGPIEEERRDLDVYAGEEAETIRRARQLARLLMGWSAPAREVDAYILQAWRDRVPGEALLARARTPPPAPDAAPPPPWRGRSPELRAVRGALDRLDALQATLRGITPVLARAWARVSEDYLWVEAGFDRAGDCARELLGMSLRSAQRLARLGRGLAWYPEIAAAIERGLSPQTAERLVDLTPDDDAAAWLRLAERIGRREHHRAIDDARRSAGRPALARYAAAIDLADRWAATPDGAAALRGPFEEDATSAGGDAPRLLVALRHPEPEVSSPVRAPPGFLGAARWFLATVEVPVGRGFARIKQRDGHRCTNPECGRRSLRTEAHHLHPRSLGGSDDAWNGVGVCRMCHMRGIHAGRVSARRVVVEGHDAVLWAWPDGRRVLQLRDEPGRPGVFGMAPA